MDLSDGLICSARLPVLICVYIQIHPYTYISRKDEYLGTFSLRELRWLRPSHETSGKRRKNEYTHLFPIHDTGNLKYLLRRIFIQCSFQSLPSWSAWFIVFLCVSSRPYQPYFARVTEWGRIGRTDIRLIVYRWYLEGS